MYVLERIVRRSFSLRVEQKKKQKSELVLSFRLSFQTLCLICYIFKGKQEDKFRFSSKTFWW